MRQAYLSCDTSENNGFPRLSEWLLAWRFPNPFAEPTKRTQAIDLKDFTDTFQI
jgi:hypothetical protein